MKKFMGIIIIIFSSFLGLVSAIGYGESMIFCNILFWLISLPSYIGGQIVRTSKYEFKTYGRQWLKYYIFIFFIAPMLIHLSILSTDYKENTFKDDKLIIFRDSASFLGDIDDNLFIVLIGILFFRFFSDIKKGLLNVLIIVVSVFLVLFSYLSFSEYRGVHEELGLISSDRKGEKYTIPYEEIETVYLEPYVEYSRKRTDFVWTLYFQPKNQHEVVYNFGLSKDNLQSTIDVREVITAKGIPFIVGEMDEETLDWFLFEMELSELEEERYYELFHINM